MPEGKLAHIDSDILGAGAVMMYLDDAASSPPWPKAACESIQPQFGNPGALHPFSITKPPKQAFPGHALGADGIKRA